MKKIISFQLIVTSARKPAQIPNMSSHNQFVSNLRTTSTQCISSTMA